MMNFVGFCVAVAVWIVLSRKPEPLFADEPMSRPYEYPARESLEQRLLRRYVRGATRYDPALSRFIADLSSTGATVQCKALAVQMYKSGALKLDQLFIEPR